MSERTIADELRAIAAVRPAFRRWDWTFVVERAADRINELEARITALESAREQDRATLARVEAVAEGWLKQDWVDLDDPTQRACAAVERSCARELRAALAPQGEREG